jgi:hypothetical protein
MHTVEEESRFAIQPVYPDRQAVFCVEERSTNENLGKKVAVLPAGVNCLLGSWNLTRQKSVIVFYLFRTCKHQFIKSLLSL